MKINKFTFSRSCDDTAVNFVENIYDRNGIVNGSRKSIFISSFYKARIPTICGGKLTFSRSCDHTAVISNCGENLIAY